MKTKTVASKAEANRFFVSAVVLSLSVWPVGFYYGAYGEVLYRHMFQIWAASIAALLAALYIGRDSKGEWFLSPFRAFLLCMPTLWVLFKVFIFRNHMPLDIGINFVFTVASIIVALPQGIRILIVATMPEATHIHNRRLDLGLLVVTLLIALVAGLIGHYNNLIMTCHDFKVAGDMEPQNCYQASDSGRWSDR